MIDIKDNNKDNVFFLKAEIVLKGKIFDYYKSPILCEYDFIHGFFTKSSSEKYIPLISSHFNQNYNNCIVNQIHSNKIVYGSSSIKKVKLNADGLISDKFNQNLWIYTADCMPILFADKKKRYIAAIHCGRRGLEKRIIKNLIKAFDKMGSSRDDILVAIGPSISKKYLLDVTTLKEFHKKTFTTIGEETGNKLINTEEGGFMQVDLRKYAQKQLLSENIPKINIDVSNLCTFESKNEFHSWRRAKTQLRQWNFICI